MSKPKAPEPDYKEMWQNYSTWSADMGIRQRDDLSMAEAKMARGGIKRDTEGWNLNMSNLRKQQSKERRELLGTETATDLWGKMIETSQGYGVQLDHRIYGTFEQQYAREKKQSILNQLYQERRNLEQSFYYEDNDSRRKVDYKARSKALGDFDKNYKSRYQELSNQWDEKAQKQLESKNFFEDVTFETTSHGEGGDRVSRTHKREITPGGRLYLQQLTSQEVEGFGRPLQGWEAMAYMTYGPPEGIGKSVEEEDRAQAQKFAGGQSSQRTSADAAAAESAKQSNTASPWVSKRTDRVGMMNFV